MIFYFYSPSHFEKWDYRNPLDKGIGGSETAHIEVAIRLAKRGHTVFSYSPLPKDLASRLWAGVEWRDLREADFMKEGIWVIGRAPQIADRFKLKTDKQKLWLVMQDTVYPQLKKTRALRFDYLFPLCEQHMIVTENEHPEVKDRLVKSANGIRTDIIEKLEPQERDPHRLIYASSPDRGLINLLRMFPKIRQKVPDASLHIFYGFDNIEKLVMGEVPIDELGTTREDVERSVRQPGVFWRGRIGQMDLYTEYLKSGVWAYPTRFAETSCITSMEAQALGAIPVTNPFWALADNIMYGSLIDGDPAIDRLTQMRYVEEIVKWMNVHENSNSYRRSADIEGNYYIDREEMMRSAQKRFDWEKVVDQYEQLAQN